MNPSIMRSNINGQGQILGFKQVRKGIELQVASYLGNNQEAALLYLYTALTPQEFKPFSEHLAELVNNRVLSIQFEAEVESLRAIDDKNKEEPLPVMHVDVKLTSYQISVAGW